ncbi:MAG: aldehyde dehydrogenase family protein, partial [bacterium]
MPERFYNYIDGKWVPPSTGKYREDRNPANVDDVIGEFPESSAEDVARAVESAKRAYNKWRLIPAPQRGVIMKRAGDLLVKYKEELAQLMTREMGKVIKEARGDVQEGIDTAYYAFGESRRLFSISPQSELPNKMGFTIRVPIGIAGLITPWNFPIAIPSWKIFPALTCGNTVVIKPASDTPACCNRLVEILAEAGIPDGVVNLVHGSGRDVGIPIVEHPDVKVISFTGSSEVGRDIAKRCGERLKKLSLELGGKNAQLVLNDADLELALEGIIWGAFGTTGQRCTATSRLILEDGIHDKFLDMLVERTKKLRLGYGLDPTVDVGPVINQQQLERIHNYAEIGKSEGATLLVGGEPATDGELKKGWFYKPTIFVNVKPNMRIFREEIFGPVLSVVRVKDFEEGVEVLNDSNYGLSSSIYTRDLNKAFIAMRDFEAGITYINGATIGAECHYPFGGVKDTGNGHREGGWTVYEIFSEWKTIYVDYSGKL